MKTRNTSPIVSVIIPVFKVEDYLSRCVESVINQTYKKLEIILVDDGSPDSSPAICDGYAKKDVRIKVLHKKNGGLSSARNAGLEVAQGEYVYFLDSDDYISSNCFSLLVENALQAGVDIVMGNVKCKNNKTGKEWTFCRAHPKEKEKWNELQFWENAFAGNTNCIIACNKLYKSTIFDSLRFEEGKLNEDELILHKIISSCKTIISLPDFLYYYCQNDESITHKQSQYLGASLIKGLLAREEYFEKNDMLQFACLQMLVIMGGTSRRKIGTELYKKIVAKIKQLSDSKASDQAFRKKAKLFLASPSAYVQIRKIRERLVYGKIK